jgi:hypothetical protein
MTTYTWPTGPAYTPREASLLVLHNQASSESALSGYTQTLTRPGSRFGWRFDFSNSPEADRRALEAFVMRLRGRENRVRLWDIKAPRPVGSANLSGVTVAAPVAAFAYSMQLQGVGPFKTLRAGDWFATATQLHRVVEDATADAGGLITVHFEHGTRYAVGTGNAITLEKPTTLYTLAASQIEFPRVAGLAAAPFSLEFIEAFA